MVMGMVCDKDTAAMFEAEVEHGATEHVTIYISIVIVTTIEQYIFNEDSIKIAYICSN